MNIRLFTLFIAFSLSVSLFAQSSNEKAIVKEKIVEKVETATSKDITKINSTSKNKVDKKKDSKSDLSKALNDRPITKWLFAISLFLLLGVIMALYKIYSSGKKS